MAATTPANNIRNRAEPTLLVTLTALATITATATTLTAATSTATAKTDDRPIASVPPQAILK